MRQWIRTLPAKVICFILCVTGLVFTVASVISAVLFVNEGLYNQTKEYRIETEFYETFCRDANDIILLESEIRNFNVDHTAFAAENTNLRFQLLDASGAVIAQNIEDKQIEDDSIWKYCRYFEVTPAANDGLGGFTVQNDGTDYKPDKAGVYTVRAYLEDGLPNSDMYALIAGLLDIAFAMRYAVYPIGVFSFALMLICFIVLMCTSARRPDSEALHPGLLNRVPIDLLIVFMLLFYAIVIVWMNDTFHFQIDSLSRVITGILFALVTANIFLALCMSIAARMKQKMLLKNTVIWMLMKLPWTIIKWIGKLLMKIPLIWKVALAVLGISVVEFVAIVGLWNDLDVVVIFWLIEKIILVPVILYIALMLRKLQQGGTALAKGDLHYKVDTTGMFGDFKRHGKNLNSIASGMSIAVEERLQSERMKTELITNVSHDIKTPLTSIINYANLIGEESCDSEHHKEYAEVLLRKSEHLKRLLDDLVEISKASSGNLEIVLSACDAGVLLTQVAGEFEQRCQTADLELVTNQPEENIVIMADSRRIWRVFENLMSNVCKYSLAGSRVYLQLERIGREAIFTFRNTSRTALNISADELMERFVRGDASRSTEGNGLGLSIAKSLTELQNGNMDITIDGDLFKVTVKFPVV